MASIVKERHNGKMRYKCRFTYKQNGKTRWSKTGWFDTEQEARRRSFEIIEAKKDEEKLNEMEKQSMTLQIALKRYVDYLEKRSNRKTTENTTTDKTNWKRANTIYSSEIYFPKEIRNKKISDLRTIDFRKWIKAINETDISGNYMRALRSLIQRFNEWLGDNEYYQDGTFHTLVATEISQTRIKKKNYKNREQLGERNRLSLSDFETLKDYLKKDGLGDFKHFYWYCLFYVLYFSGLRAEELIALQWKHILFNDQGTSNSYIYVRNAISERELRENVNERVSKEIYRLKNESSERSIIILRTYKELLEDYKESYFYEYNLTLDELNEAFVFPSLVGHTTKKYQTAKTIRNHLSEVIDEAHLPPTDTQMFRHSVASILTLPEPDGFGMSIESVFHYFGHSDEAMLETVYATKTAKQKDRMATKELLKNNLADYVETQSHIEKRERNAILLKRLQGDNKEAEEQRRIRLFQQLNVANRKKQKTFYFNKRSKNIIEEYKKLNPEIEMEFVEVDLFK